MRWDIDTPGPREKSEPFTESFRMTEPLSRVGVRLKVQQEQV